MTAARDLLADLRSRGIELDTDGNRLRWRPGWLVSAPLAERIGSHRLELIALVRRQEATASCPKCRWPLDSAGRCPKCFDRLCIECGQWTGSYLIQRCVTCGHFLTEMDHAKSPAG